MQNRESFIEVLETDHSKTIRYLQLDACHWHLDEINFWVVDPLIRRLNEVATLLEAAPRTASEARAQWLRLESVSDRAVDLAAHLDAT